MPCHFTLIVNAWIVTGRFWFAVGCQIQDDLLAQMEPPHAR